MVKLFKHVAGESHSFLSPTAVTKFQFSGSVKYTGWKIANFLPQSQFISETVLDISMVTMDH